jgi:hypothetical protein
MSGMTSFHPGTTNKVVWESDQLNYIIDNLGKDNGGVPLGNIPQNTTTKASMPSYLASSSVDKKNDKFTASAGPVLHSEGHPTPVTISHKTCNHNFPSNSRLGTSSRQSPPETTHIPTLHSPVFHNSKPARNKTSGKIWKPKKQRRRLVIGMDVGLEETCQLSLCALVGRFAYKSRCSTTFKDWMQTHWFSILGYLPKHWTLNFGWFGLVFNSPEDAELILSSFWAFEGGSIML